MTAACKSSWPRARLILEQMQRKAIEPNDKTYSAAISRLLSYLRLILLAR